MPWRSQSKGQALLRGGRPDGQNVGRRKRQAAEYIRRSCATGVLTCLLPRRHTDCLWRSGQHGSDLGGCHGQAASVRRWATQPLKRGGVHAGRQEHTGSRRSSAKSSSHALVGRREWPPCAQFRRRSPGSAQSPSLPNGNLSLLAVRTLHFGILNEACRSQRCGSPPPSTTLFCLPTASGS